MRWRPKRPHSNIYRGVKTPHTILQWVTACSSAILALATIFSFFFYVLPTNQIQVLKEEIGERTLELSKLSSERDSLSLTVGELESEIQNLEMARAILTEESANLQKDNESLRDDNKLLADTGEALRETLTWYQNQPTTSCTSDNCEEVLLLFLRGEILKSLHTNMLMDTHLDQSSWEYDAFEAYTTEPINNFAEHYEIAYDARKIVERIARDNAPRLDDPDNTYPYPTVYRAMLIFNLLTRTANHSERLSNQCELPKSTRPENLTISHNPSFAEFLVAIPNPFSEHIRCEHDAAQRFIGEWSDEMLTAISNPDFEPAQLGQQDSK